VFFVGLPLSIMLGLDVLVVVLGAMMTAFLAAVENMLTALTPI
jgi:flagellar biosynthesis protein FliR